MEVDLLRRIAVDRDREAFTELFNNYQRLGFHLAYHITNDRAGAEEAFQEAMFRIWKSASNFKADGNPRGWIMKAISREALKWLRKRRKLKKDVSINEQLDSLPQSHASAEQSEHKELCSALKTFITQLPSGDQKLLSLYFVGGLTQTEIGKELATPQRTISLKIEEAVKKLRAKLKRSGLHAAIPLLTSNGLTEIYANAPFTPTLSSEQLFQRIDFPSEATGQIASSSVIKTPIFIALTAIIIAGIATATLFNSNTRSNPPEQTIQPIAQLKPPAKINFTDSFKQAALNPFWNASDTPTILLPDKRNKKSRLILHASQNEKGKKSTATQEPKISFLTTKSIQLENVSKQITLVVRSDVPEGEGRFEYGMQILSNSGQVFWNVSYRLSGPDKNGNFAIRQFIKKQGIAIPSKFGLRHDLSPNIDMDLKIKTLPRSPNARSDDSDDWVETLEAPSKNVKHHTDTESKITMGDSIQLRIFVKVYPGSWVKWPITYVSIKQQ